MVIIEKDESWQHLVQTFEIDKIAPNQKIHYSLLKL
jgi:uncharacterized protein YgfB (UPF0149 family)